MSVQIGKFLTFNLGHEEYGIPIQSVKEIIGIMDITYIPKTPYFIKGVINLRGKIIPVIDLRLKFGLDEIPYNQRTCIVVVEVKLVESSKLIGVIVDTVSEVANIQASEIDPPPQYGTSMNPEFLTGMGKVKGKVILLLNTDKVLSSDEVHVLSKI